MIQMRKTQSIFESHYAGQEKPFSEIIADVINDICEARKFVKEPCVSTFSCPIETILQIQLSDISIYDRACLHDVILERFVDEEGLTEIMVTEKINKLVSSEDDAKYIIQDIQMRFRPDTDTPLDIFISFFDFPLIQIK